uniref:Envelope protein n=1 Tax=Heligmosomoides polygyrus TaxID=6339 RepID=A0A183GX83_HELPZ
LIATPHETREVIRIYSLPKTLIHSISSNLSTFNTIGPALWVAQGICGAEDIKWSSLLTCMCNGNLSTFNTIGPALWVAQGICGAEDIKWSSLLTCMCNGLVFWRRSSSAFLSLIWALSF